MTARSRAVPRLAALVAALAAAVGYLGSAEPLVFLLFIGAIAFAGLVVVAYTMPKPALAGCCFLVLVAGTKFRTRDTATSLSGAVDSQIYMELAIYGLLALAVLLTWLARSPGVVRSRPIELILLAYVGVAILSSVWSEAPTFTMVRSVQLLILWVFVFTLVRAFGPGGALRTVSGALVVYVLVFAGMAVVFPWAATEEAFEVGGRDRFSWFAMHPITAGAHAGVAALFVILEGLRGGGLWRRRWLGVPLWAYLPPLIAITVAAKSRGPLFAFVAGLGAIVARKYLRPPTAAALAGAALLVAIGFVSYGQTFTEFVQWASGGDNPISRLIFQEQRVEHFLGMSGRVDLWRVLVDIFAEQPLQGYGYHASRTFILKIVPWAGYAHNALIQTLLDNGVVGAALVWGPFAAALVFGLRGRVVVGPEQVAPREMLAVFLVFLVVNSVSSESFAAAPGGELLVMLTCVMGAQHIAARAVNRSSVQVPDLAIEGRLRASANPVRPAGSPIPEGAASRQ